jgi:hypothetical protein
MRNIIWDLEFVHEILKKASQVAILGGLAALAAGLVLGKISMVLAGAFVTLVGSVEFVLSFLGKRNSN